MNKRELKVMVGNRRRSFATPWRERRKVVRQQREADTIRRIDLVEVTLESKDANEVQRCPAPLENHVTGAAVALGPEDRTMSCGAGKLRIQRTACEAFGASVSAET